MSYRTSKMLLVIALMCILALATGGWTASQVGPPETLDDVLLSVHRQAPAFGGMFADGDTLKVYLTNLAQRSQAERALAAAFGAAAMGAGNVQFIPGKYDFGQLKAWQSRAGNVLEFPGVVFTDADEATNRVTIGVEYAVAAAAVEQSLQRLGIPREAVEILETEPIVQLATLRDRVRPLQGGLQINFPGYLCTYGFSATRGDVQGFVTNSHCTSKQGGVEGTQYWQPTQTIDPTLIGVEIADPGYSKCPSGIKGRVCRYSDSAFVRLNVTDATLGRLAKPDSVNSGSINIAGSFTISGAGTAKVGDVVGKVGRTTGWSQGRVTRSCVDTAVSGSNIVQLCQTHVSANVASGDSGSPVFSGNSNVALLGILWGGSTSSFVYSPIGNITRGDELGPLTIR